MAAFTAEKAADDDDSSRGSVYTFDAFCARLRDEYTVLSWYRTLLCAGWAVSQRDHDACVQRLESDATYRAPAQFHVYGVLHICFEKMFFKRTGKAEFIQSASARQETVYLVDETTASDFRPSEMHNRRGNPLADPVKQFKEALASRRRKLLSEVLEAATTQEWYKYVCKAPWFVEDVVSVQFEEPSVCLDRACRFFRIGRLTLRAIPQADGASLDVWKCARCHAVANPDVLAHGAMDVRPVPKWLRDKADEAAGVAGIRAEMDPQRPKPFTRLLIEQHIRDRSALRRVLKTAEQSGRFHPKQKALRRASALIASVLYARIFVDPALLATPHGRVHELNEDVLRRLFQGTSLDQSASTAAVAVVQQAVESRAAAGVIPPVRVEMHAEIILARAKELVNKFLDLVPDDQPLTHLQYNAFTAIVVALREYDDKYNAEHPRHLLSDFGGKVIPIYKARVRGDPVTICAKYGNCDARGDKTGSQRGKMYYIADSTAELALKVEKFCDEYNVPKESLSNQMRVQQELMRLMDNLEFTADETFAIPARAWRTEQVCYYFYQKSCRFRIRQYWDEIRRAVRTKPSSEAAVSIATREPVVVATAIINKAMSMDRDAVHPWPKLIVDLMEQRFAQDAGTSPDPVTAALSTSQQQIPSPEDGLMVRQQFDKLFSSYLKARVSLGRAPQATDRCYQFRSLWVTVLTGINYQRSIHTLLPRPGRFSLASVERNLPDAVKEKLLVARLRSESTAASEAGVKKAMQRHQRAMTPLRHSTFSKRPIKFTEEQLLQRSPSLYSVWKVNPAVVEAQLGGRVRPAKQSVTVNPRKRRCAETDVAARGGKRPLLARPESEAVVQEADILPVVKVENPLDFADENRPPNLVPMLLDRIYRMHHGGGGEMNTVKTERGVKEEPVGEIQWD